MSSNALCPKCGKPIEQSEGKPCPHCGAINTEAIISLDNAEPIAVPPATAITANLRPATAITADLPPESADKTTCPRCGKRFDAVNDAAVSWLSCPFCHEVNPDALVKRTPPNNNIFGGCLVGLGLLGVTLGTLLCWLGMTFDLSGQRPTKFLDIAVTVLWAAASLAIMATGVFVISSETRRAIQKNYWGPGAFFLILVLMGFAGWIFAFSTCAFLPR
ncbi:MAG TPA: hypothetical protein VKE98_00710 [Gemmataceae bacterium]|nr:hypothetical protein [Gemmataceae bacterium]